MSCKVAPTRQRWNNCLHCSYVYVNRLRMTFDSDMEAKHGAHRNFAGSANRRHQAGAPNTQSFDEARARLARGFPPRAGGDRSARLASVGRGPDRAVDGRCLTDQMASRPRHLVLRAVSAGAERSDLQDLRRTLSVPVQLLLRRRRSAPRAPATRADHAAERRRRRRLSRPCRCGGRAADRKCRRRRPSACSPFSRSACITSSSIRNC